MTGMNSCARGVRRTGVGAVLLFSVMVLGGPVWAQSGIFAPAPSVVPPSGDQAPLAVTRQRSVRLDLDAFAGSPATAQEAIAASDSMIVNLFDDANYEIVQTASYTGYKSRTVWEGAVVGAMDGEAYFVVKDDVLVGEVSAAGRKYRIRYAGDGTNVVEELNASAFTASAGSIVSSAEVAPWSSESSDEQAAPTPVVMEATDDGSLIRIMVVYTPNARFAVGGTTAMINTIVLEVTKMNTGLANSLILPRVQLAHTAEVNYNSNGDLSNDLIALIAKTDGVMDGVHVLRDKHRADAVSLFTAFSNLLPFTAVLMEAGFVGPEFAPFAFNVIPVTSLAGSFHFSTVFGANFGSTVDRANADAACPGCIPSHPYSYGFQAPDGAFRTIMTLPSALIPPPICPGPGTCPPINHWSNPNVDFAGQPTGIDHGADPDNSADNARSINDNALIIANWRQGPCALVVTSPNGGENLVRGDPFTIEWNGTADGDSVNLALFRGRDLVTVIARNVPDTGSYAWTVPARIRPGDNYRIKIRATHQKRCKDLSDLPFSIVPAPCTLQVVEPNGGDFWPRGETVPVNWTGDHPGTTVDVLLFKGRKRLLILGAGLTANPDPLLNDFEWDVPLDFPLGTNYRIVVRASVDGRCRDVSDSRFSIVRGICTLEVVSPSGSDDKWFRGETATVTWAGFGPSGLVDIILFRGTTRVRVLETNVIVWNFAFSWDVPLDMPLGDNYRVVIRDALDSHCRAVSSVPFSVVRGPCSLTVLSPNGGETLRRGDQFTIMWTGASPGDTVRIQLIKGGKVIGRIPMDVPDTGSIVTGFAPDIPLGRDYRIRIVAGGDRTCRDASDGTFIIETQLIP